MTTDGTLKSLGAGFSLRSGLLLPSEDLLEEEVREKNISLRASQRKKLLSRLLMLTAIKKNCPVYLKSLNKRKGIYLQKVCWVCSILVSKKIVSIMKFERSRNEMNLKYMWHLRFDHIREDRINKLEWYEHLGSLTLESFSIYKFCIQEKMAKLSFVGYGVRLIEILVLEHTNVCSPCDVQARSGSTSSARRRIRRSRW